VEQSQSLYTNGGEGYVRRLGPTALDFLQPHARSWVWEDVDVAVEVVDPWRDSIGANEVLLQVVVPGRREWKRVSDVE
jgi:hypothetical protein